MCEDFILRSLPVLFSHCGNPKIHNPRDGNHEEQEKEIKGRKAPYIHNTFVHTTHKYGINNTYRYLCTEMLKLVPLSYFITMS